MTPARLIVIALSVLLAALLLTHADLVHAQEVPGAAAPNIYERMQQWNQVINAKVGFAVENPRYFRAAQVFWMVFSIYTIAMLFLRVGVGGFTRNLPEFVDRFIMIAFVWGLMTTYNTWTGLVSEVFAGLGEILQTSLTGDPDPFAPAFRILYAAESVNYETGFALLDIASSIPIIVASLLFTVLMFLLCVVAAGASMWAYWGYTVMKLIGLFFVPFMLFDRLSSWFDNWFSLFCAFSVYNLLVTLSLNLASYAFYIGLGYSDPSVPPNSAPIVITSAWQVFPLIFFACMCIYGIWRCSTLAQALMGTSGVSAQIRSLSSSVSSAFQS